MQVVRDLRSWLAAELRYVRLSEDCQAYVVSVLASADDMSGVSISIAAMEAKLSGDVRRLIRVADWGLYRGTIDPRCLRANGRLLLSLSSSSYASAYRLTNGTWPIFLELGGHLEEVAVEAHKALRGSAVTNMYPHSR